MSFKVKIQDRDITFGPNDLSVPVDPLVVMTLVKELTDKGYRRTSNAYCHISRIDRPDWLTVMATAMHTCVANFYNTDGSGVPNSWKNHYVRSYSEDNHTVHPDIVRKIPSY